MAEFGSCISTKDIDDDKFFVMDCDGVMMESAKTLDEAQVKADGLGCAIVIKILRLCGGADMSVLTGSEEEFEEFDEEI